METASIVKQFDSIETVDSPFETLLFFGHEKNQQQLETIFHHGKLAHAIIFEGQAGIGKSGIAFQFALNLIKNSPLFHWKIDPQDNDYLQMMSGVHSQFFYLARHYDARKKSYLSSISIDQIREIKHFLSRTALSKAWRIILIDALDDLNYAAANALLKILEEPPPYCLFILISHNKKSGLDTIRSRCQTLVFQPLTQKNLQQALQQSQNNILDDLNLEQQKTLFTLSSGSVRTALLLLLYGGFEIIHNIEGVLQKQNFHYQEANKIATALSVKSAEMQYKLFCQYVLSWLATQAKKHIQTHEKVTAFHMSTLWQNIQQQMQQTDLYHLDKKQAILLWLDQIHQVFYKKTSNS